MKLYDLFDHSGVSMLSIGVAVLRFISSEKNSFPVLKAWADSSTVGCNDPRVHDFIIAGELS